LIIEHPPISHRLWQEFRAEIPIMGLASLARGAGCGVAGGGATLIWLWEDMSSPFKV